MYPRKREHFSEVTFCSKILDPLHKFTEFQLHMRKQREIEWPSAVERSLHFWNQKQRLFFFLLLFIYLKEREGIERKTEEEWERDEERFGSSPKGQRKQDQARLRKQKPGALSLSRGWQVSEHIIHWLAGALSAGLRLMDMSLGCHSYHLSFLGEKFRVHGHSF